MKIFLKSFSYLFHPLFIPTMALLLFWNFNDGSHQNTDFYLLLFQILILTILIPISFFYLLKSMGKVDNLMIANINQRKIPLCIHIVLMLILLMRSNIIPNFAEIYYFFVGSIMSAFVAFLLIFANQKASLHLVGISALAVFAVLLSLHFQIRMFEIIIGLIACVGIVASSRLELKAHDFKELAIGFVVGVLPQLLFFCCWK